MLINRKQIEFYCPECHKQTSCVVHEKGIFADLREPCLQCVECSALWRITLAYCEKN